MRIVTAATLLVVVLAAEKAAPMALEQLPASWTHRMTDGCQWKPRPWAITLHAEPKPEDTAQTRDERYRCQLRRGLKSRTRFVKTILGHFPTPEERAAWERVDGNDYALRPGR